MLGGRACVHTRGGAPPAGRLWCWQRFASNHNTLSFVFQLLSRVNIDYIWHHMSRNRQ